MVKLSSLGDVVHTMPAVQDVRVLLPQAQIDWVVETGFAPLVRRCAGVEQVIECGLRGWRRAPLAQQTRREWHVFRAELKAAPYDAVIDLQGLTKSAWVAWQARLTSTGKRYAMANRTDGSSYEAPTRWVADVRLPMTQHVHAVRRARDLCAGALGYEVPAVLRWGLAQRAGLRREVPGVVRPEVALVHGTSRADKLWPVPHWIELARHLTAQGMKVALPHGNAAERERSNQIASAVHAFAPGMARVWPTLGLDALTDRLARTTGVIGVDSGLSHIAVALGLPHVQIYNFDTAWRTGPLPGLNGGRQLSVYDPAAPSVAAVTRAWQDVLVAAGRAA